MKYQNLVLILLVLITFSISCTNEEENITENPLNLADCELNQSSDPLISQVAICLNGADFALPNDTITYVSKFDATSSATDLEILWTIVSGHMEILSIETSIEDGLRKSIAIIQFNSDFSGGQINVKGIDNNTDEFATFTYPIKFRN
ncbi:hypothetical protein A9Q87_01050 [Flavobacteriales bacterium 34_180_T64]|nr:hypothetical protein A9Q87_01050 [Flavobacteriales bacterium 34_180_T64]